MILLRTQLNWQMVLPAAQSLTFQTTVVRAANTLRCLSCFVQIKAIAQLVPGKPNETPVRFCHQIPDPMLGTTGGSGSPPFIWNHSTVPILGDLWIQFFLHTPDFWCGSKKPKGLVKSKGILYI